MFSLLVDHLSQQLLREQCKYNIGGSVEVNWGGDGRVRTHINVANGDTPHDCGNNLLLRQYEVDEKYPRAFARAERDREILLSRNCAVTNLVVEVRLFSKMASVEICPNSRIWTIQVQLQYKSHSG
jgi:hypothetical protein